MPRGLEFFRDGNERLYIAERPYYLDDDVQAWERWRRAYLKMGRSRTAALRIDDICLFQLESIQKFRERFDVEINESVIYSVLAADVSDQTN